MIQNSILQSIKLNKSNKTFLICLFLAFIGPLSDLNTLKGAAWGGSIHFKSLCEAIKRAENNPNYGILKGCDIEVEGMCRYHCEETVKNNYKRWIQAGKPTDYLTFLWHRYSPPDSHPLNRNWLKNVSYFYLKDKLKELS